MKQSPNDNKTYKALTLENGLRVLLIHHPNSQKAAAALAVNVGHFSDPCHRQGMAHFLEHMLFLGTKTYPDGSEYQKFISQNGGSNNAWTSTEHTCFFFDIHHQHLANALHRFGQFFSCPLLSEEFVNKERQNIDAEFKLKLKDDIRRLYDVHKETINPAHPFAKFSVGNNETLSDTDNSRLRDELQAFFEQYYRAPYMTLAIEGPQSIEELSLLAQQNFADIATTNESLPEITEPLYLPENLNQFIKVKPVKNDKQLIISFAMPAIDKHYRHKPEAVIAYLMGHEGPGSILSLLKNKKWALGLTAGAGINGSNFKDFNINIPLTDLGEQHITDIVTIIFNYTNTIKANPIPKFYYQEKKAIAELSFNYHEKMRPMDSVSQLVINMQHYPAEDYIFGDYVMAGMDAEAVSGLLNYLSPNNMRLIQITQTADFDKQSKWYQVPYSIAPIAQTEINQWLNCGENPELFMPPENQYISANPIVLECEDKEPKNIPSCIDNKNGINIWFKQDNTFKVPKGYIYIGIDTPNVIASNQSIAAAHLFVDLFSDAIVEQFYDAELAGIHYHLYAHQGGMTLQLSGISEKQPQLLEKLLISLTAQQFSIERFELIKQQLITHWQNADKSKSISQLFSKLSSIMQPKNPESEILADELTNLSYDEFNNFARSLFNQVALDVLIHGNWHKKHAGEISKIIQNYFSASTDEKYRSQIPVLNIESRGEINFPLYLADHDFASVIYYPQKTRELKLTAMTMITSHLLSPLFFQEMRTEKQYGYLVGVGFVPINRYPGIAFYIQSPHTDSQGLQAAITDFIKQSTALIDDMSDIEWQQLQQGLSGQLLEKDASLRIKSQRFWASISNQDGEFNKKLQLIEIIRSLTLDDIKTFINDNLIGDSKADRINLLSFQAKEQFDSFVNQHDLLTSVAEFENKYSQKH